MTAIEGWLINFDMTVYEGGTLVPGAAEAVERLGERDVPFLFTTNTSRMSRRAVVEHLAGLGLHVEPERPGRPRGQPLARNPRRPRRSRPDRRRTRSWWATSERASPSSG